MSNLKKLNRGIESIYGVKQEEWLSDTLNALYHCL